MLILAYFLFKTWSQRRQGKRTMNTTSDRVAHRSDHEARARAGNVEAQVDALADTDATFDGESLKQRAVSLYVTAQRAWTAGDMATLNAILTPVVYGKWAEQLGEYVARGEVNVVEIVEGPDVEMVNVANRPGETDDTVTFRITATLDDYVVSRRTGALATRKDRSRRPVEYWTLRKDGQAGGSSLGSSRPRTDVTTSPTRSRPTPGTRSPLPVTRRSRSPSARPHRVRPTCLH